MIFIFSPGFLFLIILIFKLFKLLVIIFSVASTST